MVAAGNSITQIMLGSFVFIAILYLWDCWGEIVVVLGKAPYYIVRFDFGKKSPDMYGACFKVGQSGCAGTSLKACSGTSDEMTVACTKVVEGWKQVGGSERFRKVRNLMSSLASLLPPSTSRHLPSSLVLSLWYI